MTGPGRAATWEKLDEALAAYTEWLRSPQPDGAMYQHHGFHTHVGGLLSITGSVNGRRSEPTRSVFPPRERKGEPKNTGHLNLLLPDVEWTDYDVVDDDGVRHRAGELAEGVSGVVDMSSMRHGPPVPPMTDDEVAYLTERVKATGLTVYSTWKCGGSSSHGLGFTVGGRNAIHPKQMAAASRYLDGCPKPGHSVFCGGWQASDDEQKACTWHDGFDLAVPPAWPHVPYPSPPRDSAGDEDDDRNLEAVKRALARLTPILAELGLHPGTVVAGRRGTIEGVADLRFEPTAGHGICLPAEAAELLTSLAMEGRRLTDLLGEDR